MPLMKIMFVSRHRPAYSTYTGPFDLLLPPVDTKFTPEIEPLLLNAKVRCDSSLSELNVFIMLSGGILNTPKCDEIGDDAGRLRGVGTCA